MICDASHGFNTFIFIFGIKFEGQKQRISSYINEARICQNEDIDLSINLLN